MQNNKIPYQMKRTLQGIKNELLSMTNLPLIPEFDLTINHKWGVKSNVAPIKKPTIAYIGFGIGGCYNVDDGNLSSPYQIKVTNKDLYLPIPIRCVPVDQDLSSEERSLYRMRVRRTFGDQEYWCYYFKKIIFNSNVKMTQTDPITLEEIPYEEDPNDLTPTPPQPPYTGTVNTNESEINVSLTGSVTVYGSEILEGISTIYNDARRATISEIGIYTGEDMEVTGLSGTGSDIQYTEAIYAQLATHYTSIGVPLLTPDSFREININFTKGNIMLL